jgi:hypothetical protein
MPIWRFLLATAVTLDAAGAGLYAFRNDNAVGAETGLRVALCGAAIRPARLHGYRVRRAAGQTNYPGRGDADDACDDFMTCDGHTIPV